MWVCFLQRESQLTEFRIALGESLGKCQAFRTSDVNTQLYLGKYFILKLHHMCSYMAFIVDIFLKSK